jgi:hypothetical protein
MLGDDPPVLTDYDAIGIGMNLDRTPDRTGGHRGSPALVTRARRHDQWPRVFHGVKGCNGGPSDPLASGKRHAGWSFSCSDPLASPALLTGKTPEKQPGGRQIRNKFRVCQDWVLGDEHQHLSLALVQTKVLLNPAEEFAVRQPSLAVEQHSTGLDDGGRR